MLESTREMTIRTRIAPSPTGFAHVGTAYTALFNFAFARSQKGKFIIRIEDTDVKRHVKGAEEAIYAGLDWLGLDWDEGPAYAPASAGKPGKYGSYRQSERLSLYKKYAQKLLEEKKAFEDEGAIRFKSAGEDISWNDLIRGKVTFPAKEVTDFVMIKSDGYPTYNFAVAIDDIEMKITHVIRGEEHISNTPRQIAIYKTLNIEPPYFAHLPTLRNADHKKLSKRRDPVDLRIYREQGYLPEALVNFLCLLGWSHPEEKEVFTLQDFIDNFDLKRVRCAGPIFDTKKLDWLNGIYIRQKTDEELLHLMKPYISQNVSDKALLKVIPLVKERIAKLSEVESLISFFWQRPQIGKELFQNEQCTHHISAAAQALGEIKKWNLENINNSLTKTIEKEGFKTGDFYMTIRLSLTGTRITPPINESMVILGQDEALFRLQEAEKVLLEKQ